MARTLDIVGDRWTLLIVRELLLRPELRFKELATGLPGVASNLLADRLRSLQADGVLETVGAEGTGGYRLTARGQALAPVIRELTAWGLPLMMARADGDVWQGRWAALAVDALLADVDTSGCVPFHALISTDEDDAVHVIVRPGRAAEVTTTTGSDHQPDDVTVRIAGTVSQLQEFLGGDLSGVDVKGDPGPLMALLAGRV